MIKKTIKNIILLLSNYNQRWSAYVIRKNRKLCEEYAPCIYWVGQKVGLIVIGPPCIYSVTVSVTYGFNPKGHMTYRSHRSWFQRQTRPAMPCRMKEILNRQRNENDPLRPSTEELQHQQPTTVAEVCIYMAEERHGTKTIAKLQRYSTRHILKTRKLENYS